MCSLILTARPSDTDRNADSRRRLFLDSRDLIMLLTDRAAIDVRHLGQNLRERGWAIILTDGVLRELLPADANRETLRLRLEALRQSVPVRMVREHPVALKEWRCGVRQFLATRSERPLRGTVVTAAGNRVRMKRDVRYVIDQVIVELERHRANIQFFARADDADGDFSAIGYQKFFKHGM